MLYFDWIQGQANEIKFVMVDTSGNEIAGLGDSFVLEISAPGNSAFIAGVGTKSELGHGWYRYLADPSEASSRGVVGIRITAAGSAQQNLVANIGGRNLTAVEFTYTVVSGTTPLPDASVWIATDAAGNNVLFVGITDNFGVLRDLAGQKPFLDPGMYHFFVKKSGYTFPPDTEVVG